MIPIPQPIKTMFSKSNTLLMAATAVTLGTSIPCNAAKKETGTEVSFRVICTETRDGVDMVLAPTEGAAKVEVPLYVGNFSELLKARFTDQKATFYIEDKGSDSKDGRKLVAEGPLAKGARQAFVVTPSATEGGPIYQILAFDDTDGSFKMGSTRVINLAPLPVRLNVAGKVQDSVPAQQSADYPICKDVDEWNMYSVSVDLEVKEGDWRKIATQSWRASDRKRDWVFISYDAATKKPAVKQFQDIPPWEADDLETKGGKSKK